MSQNMSQNTSRNMSQNTSRNEEEKSSLLDKLRFWGVAVFFPCYVLVGSVVYIFVSLIFKPFWRTSANWFLWMAVIPLKFILGLKTELRDSHKLKTAPKGVIVMNHQTIWDFFVVISVYHKLGDTIHTLSRKEVFFLWPLGFAMHLSGSLFIDLKTRHTALESLMTQCKKVLTPSNPLKSKVIIFPEGTRNPKIGGDFLQFKRGAFKVALDCNVPVIPIVCSPHTFVKKFKYFRPGKVVVRCLDPVTLDPKVDLDPQIEAIKRAMQTEYTKLIEELGITPEK